MMMSVKDVFKDSFLKGIHNDVSVYTVLLVFGMSLLLGLFIYWVYKYKTKSAFYNRDFNNVLVGLPIVTAAIVLCMQASIVVSLGMVGALSIVRFRNAVKSSMDLLYLFWSISIGIICGAQIYNIAIILTVVITVLLFLMDLIPNKVNSVLVVATVTDEEGLTLLQNKLKLYDKHVQLRSCVKNRTGINCIFETSVKDQIDLFKEVSALNKVNNVNVVLNDGNNRLG